MGWTDGLPRVLRPWRTGRALQREVDDELRFHIDMSVEERRAEGIDEDTARSKVLARFGSLQTIRKQCLRERSRPRQIAFASATLGVLATLIAVGLVVSRSPSARAAPTARLAPFTDVRFELCTNEHTIKEMLRLLISHKQARYGHWADHDYLAWPEQAIAAQRAGYLRFWVLRLDGRPACFWFRPARQ